MKVVKLFVYKVMQLISDNYCLHTTKEFPKNTVSSIHTGTDLQLRTNCMFDKRIGLCA